MRWGWGEKHEKHGGEEEEKEQPPTRGLDAGDGGQAGVGLMRGLCGIFP